MSITVILNGYKRGSNLDEQYEALQNQTVKPDEILLWYNNPGDSDPNYEIGTKVPTAYCTANFTYMRFNAGIKTNTKGNIFQEGLGKVNFFVSNLPEKIA